MDLKNTLKIVGISMLGVLGVGLSTISGAYGMTMLNTYQSASAYSYDDNEYQIVLTEEDLENEFTHLQEYIIAHYNLTNTTIVCEDDSYTLTFIEYLPNGISYSYTDENEDYLQITFGGFDDDDSINNIWAIYGAFNEGQNVIDEFSSEIYWDFSNNYTEYEGIKNAILQDLVLSKKSLTLTANQLNDNTYEFFANQLNDLSDNSELQNSYIIYNNNVYNFNTFEIGDSLYYSNANGNQISFDTFEKKWYFYNETVGDMESFTNSITIYSNYIADNLYAPYQPSSLLEIIVGLLTGGITGIASGVGSGVSTLTTQIFINGNALSVFGGMLVVFAGLSLAIGLCRWIMQFLTSLGAKK